MSCDPVRTVFLDPDGTSAKDWIAVLIEAQTGVVYETQCGGVGATLRSAEGYLVPLGGLQFDPDAGPINSYDLTQVFHGGRGGCNCGDLDPSGLEQLRKEVSNITFWYRPSGSDDDVRASLRLDESRLDDVLEAWVPVQTPVGRGYLLWANCD